MGSRPPDDVTGKAEAATVEVVGAAIVDAPTRPRRLLAARRVEPPALAGRWELPGGKVEPGESPQEALRREITEELGVSIDLREYVPGPLAGGRWALSTRHRIAVWLATVSEGVPRPLEDHDELRWIAADDLDAVDWLPGDRPVVEALVPLLR